MHLISSSYGICCLCDRLMGFSVGLRVGVSVGISVGFMVGLTVGDTVGLFVGSLVGAGEGAKLGVLEGDTLGTSLGGAFGSACLRSANWRVLDVLRRRGAALLALRDVLSDRDLFPGSAVMRSFAAIIVRLTSPNKVFRSSARWK